MNNKITIKDIAQEAGVSPATVSGILNNSGKQTPSTVKKVLKVIDQIGYIPRRNKLRAENKRLRGKIKELAFFHHKKAEGALSKIISGMRNTLNEKDIHLKTFEINQILPTKKSMQRTRGAILYGDVLNQQIEDKYKFPCLSVSEHSYHMAQIGYNYAECGVRAAQIASDLNVTKALILHGEKSQKLEHKIAYLTFKDGLKSAAAKYTQKSFSKLSVEEIENYDLIFFAGESSETKQFIKSVKKLKSLTIVLVQSEDLKLDPSLKFSVKIMKTCPIYLGEIAAKLLLQKISDKMELPGRILIEPPLVNSLN